MDIRELDINLINLPFETWCEREIKDFSFFSFDINKEFVANLLEDSKFFDPFYHSYLVPKKRGGFREIFAPTNELKAVQRKIADFLVINKKQNLNVSFGFELNTNMVVGARKHVNKQVVINLDIKDFFQSINKKMIAESLRKTFNLNTISWKFLEIVTLKGYLPTGAPSSPVLSNIYCHEMDLELLKFSKEFKFTYTRYADDLTFSTDEKINKKNVIKFITKIIERYQFKINSKKTKVFSRSYRQEVTGLVVNEKVNLSREFRYNLKALLHNLKKDGLVVTKKKFNEKYPKKDFHSTVKGWIDFYGMVKGKENLQYIKFKMIFKSCSVDYAALLKDLYDNHTIEKNDDSDS